MSGPRRGFWAGFGLVLVLFWAAVGIGCTGSGAANLRDSAVGEIAASPRATASATVGPARRVPTRVSVVPSSADINVPPVAGFNGPRVPGSFALSGTVHYEAGDPDSDLIWTSSDPAIARVDQAGVVSSVLPSRTGTASIIAAARLDPSVMATATVLVGVFDPPVPTTPAPTPTAPPRRPVSVFVFPGTLSLSTPAEATAPAAVRYPWHHQLVGTVIWSDGGLSSDVLWSSSDPLLVAVDASGSIRSLVPGKEGSAIITATARASVNPASTSSTPVTGAATVTVRNIGPDPLPVASPFPSLLAVLPPEATINVPPPPGQSAGERHPASIQFKATVVLSDGTLSEDVLWYSSDPLIAQISSSGLATAASRQRTGSVEIRAVYRLKQAIAGTASLTVANLGPDPTPAPTPAPVTVAYVSVFPTTASINTPLDSRGSQPDAGFPTSVQLTGKVVMSDGTVTSDLLWTSSNVNLAAVSQSGAVSSVLIRTTGKALITAQSRLEPARQATAEITVVDNARVEIDVR